MPDDERVREIKEAERRGMERAAVLLDERMQSILADARKEKEYEMPAMAHCYHLTELVNAIRAEAAKHED